MEFSRQQYWSGLPFPSPGDLPDPGIEPALPSEPPGILTVHNMPQLLIHPAIFSLLSFLCILLLEEAFVQLQALQQRVPGFRAQVTCRAGEESA